MTGTDGPRYTENVVLEVIDPETGETVVFTGPTDADVDRQAAEHFDGPPAS